MPQCLEYPAIVAHHVRRNTDGGTSMKPSDRWAVPMCDCHHKEGDRIGWLTFEAKYDVDLRAQALRLSTIPPNLRWVA